MPANQAAEPPALAASPVARGAVRGTHIDDGAVSQGRRWQRKAGTMLIDNADRYDRAATARDVKIAKAKNRAQNIAPVIREIIAKGGGDMSLRAVAMVLEAR